MSEKIIVRVRDVMKKRFDLVDRMTTISDALETMEPEAEALPWVRGWLEQI